MSTKREEIVTDGLDYVLTRQDRSMGGVKTDVLKVDGGTGAVSFPAPSLLQLPLADRVLILCAVGRNGAGAVTLTGAKVGDKVVGVSNITAATQINSSFESTITVKDQIQQSTATNLSAATLLIVVSKQS